MAKKMQPTAQPQIMLDTDRKRLALESALEINVLAGLLLEKAASEGWELEPEPSMILRNLGVRIEALSMVVVSALDDPIVPTKILHERVFGHGAQPATRPHQAA